MPLQVPLLSICIPTYSRCDLLRQGLQAIAQQMTEIPLGQVEIIVSDNASSDETSQIIERFNLESPEICLHYFRQPENIGATRNVCFVAQAATGDFVYILSDDDILLPGSLKKIVSVIQAHPDLDAVCPGVSAFTAFPEKIKSLKCLQEDDLVMDRNQVLMRLGTMLTFISSVVFRKNAIRAAHANNDALFPHSFIFLAAIAREKGCLFLSQECLAPRGNESIGYDLIQAFVTDFVAVLQFAEKIGYSRNATQNVLSAHAGWVAGFLRLFRKTSYRPNLQKRIRDTAKVTGVWWRNPQALLRIEAAMWLPDVIYNPIKEILRRC